MRDAILVINAGSSSIKFSAFPTHADAVPVLLRGKLEGLGSAPHLQVENVEGRVVKEKTWPAGSALGHDDAMAHLLERLPAWLQGWRVRAVGHRVVHGGAKFSAPIRMDTELLRQLETLIPPAPLHPTTQPRPDPDAAVVGARATAGCLLRHRVPSHFARGGADVCLAAADHRTQRAPLRLS